MNDEKYFNYNGEWFNREHYELGKEPTHYKGVYGGVMTYYNEGMYLKSEYKLNRLEAQSDYVETHYYCGIKIIHKWDTTLDTQGLFIVEYTRPINDNIFSSKTQLERYITYSMKQAQNVCKSIILEPNYLNDYKTLNGGWEVIIVGHITRNNYVGDKMAKPRICFYEYFQIGCDGGLCFDYDILTTRWFGSRKALCEWWSNTCGNFTIEGTIFRSLNLQNIIRAIQDNTIEFMNDRVCDYELYCESRH